MELGQQWATLSPAAAVAIGTIASDQELQKGANAEMLGALQSQVSSATLFSSIIWAPAHFTYLEARRASTSDQWQVYYQDSLPAESGPCYQAAGKVARAVGILPATKPLMHSSSGRQKDGWSCGLWALQLMESRARAHRGEPPSPPPTLIQITHRLNEWLEKISNQYSVPIITSRKAKQKPKPRPRPTTQAQPTWRRLWPGPWPAPSAGPPS